MSREQVGKMKLVGANHFKWLQKKNISITQSPPVDTFNAAVGQLCTAAAERSLHPVFRSARPAAAAVTCLALYSEVKGLLRADELLAPQLYGRTAAGGFPGFLWFNVCSSEPGEGCAQPLLGCSLSGLPFPPFTKGREAETWQGARSTVQIGDAFLTGNYFT